MSGDGAREMVSQSMLSDDCEDSVRIEWMDHQLLDIIPTMPTSSIRCVTLDGFICILFVHCTCMVAIGMSLYGRDMVGLGLDHVRPITQQSHLLVYSHFSHALFDLFLICHSNLEMLLLDPISPE